MNKQNSYPSHHRQDWAWQQVEAMADGSLHGQPRRRMEQAMRDDPALAVAVTRARQLINELHKMPKPRASRQLLSHLWAVPAVSGVSVTRAWFMVPALAMVLLVMVVSAVITQAPVSAPTDNTYTAEQVAAARDLQVALEYMEKSAALTERKMSKGVGGGLRKAVVLSMTAWVLDDQRPGRQ